jgi:hypothetical protein
MKSKILVLLALSMTCVSVFATPVMEIKYNPMTMCLVEGNQNAVSLGYRVVINKEVLVCVNARPDSHFVDKNSPAKWVPLDKLFIR